MHLEDTIAAMATPPGGAGRGVIRVSGCDALACISRCVVSTDPRWPGGLRLPRVVAAELPLGQPAGRLPCDLYVWPGARSYTRQPCVEIHTFGAPPLLDAALRAVCAAGARLARPGEFTLRAFLAGRLDLTQVEAVLGVIDARSRRELDVALAQLAGGLAEPLHRLRDQLLDLLAHLEAGLDFADEELRFIAPAELESQLHAAAASVAALADRMSGRTAVTGEFRVVLYGAPNVGKSSLLNALSGTDAALVSDAAGTTRDYLTRHVTIHGLNCLLIDTAGVTGEQADPLAADAQAATSRQAGQAHLQLFCVDATRPRNAWEAERLNRPASAPCLIVLTKTDAGPAAGGHGPLEGRPVIATSSRTGAGLAELRSAIADRLSAGGVLETGVVTGTAVRCRESLRRAAESLDRALILTATAVGEELVAVEIRTALEELGHVVGAVYTEDLLDRIFSRFCIGK